MTTERLQYKTTLGSEHKLCTIYVKDGKAIARHVTPENAALIVKAVNSYDESNMALRNCLSFINANYHPLPGTIKIQQEIMNILERNK